MDNSRVFKKSHGITMLICMVTTLLLASTHVALADYPPIRGDNTHEWITNVTFGAINNSSAQDPSGYGNYTFDAKNLLTKVNPGSTYQLKVTIHPDTQWCDEFVTAFFDWNGDSDFTDSGERVVVATKTCSAGPHAVNVKVPANAAGGEIRMRVVLKYFGAPPSLGNIPEGEAEDYTILVNYPSIYGDNRLEWITNVSFSNINRNTSRESGGYSDFTYWTTKQVAEVTQGESYPFSVTISPDTISPASGGCYENVAVFFDWNHDGDFNDKEEKKTIAANICDTLPHAKVITVPRFAKTGKTRIRVVLRWRLQPVPTGSISGEAEDYTLLVHKGESPWILFMPAIIGHKNR